MKDNKLYMEILKKYLYGLNVTNLNPSKPNRGFLRGISNTTIIPCTKIANLPYPLSISKTISF